MSRELSEGDILEWPGTVSAAVELLRYRVPEGMGVTPTLSYTMGGMAERAPVFIVGVKFDRNTHTGLLDAAAWPLRIVRIPPDEK